MKVLLIKDVYNLGRAGEVKKVADGYARNFLFPQKMALRASEGALRQIEKIEAAAAKQREIMNEEMRGLSEQIAALELVFKAKVGETGKLYGSITQQQIIDTVNEKLHVNLDRRQIETQPLRQTGEHMVRIRLTYDLIPEVTVWVESDEEVEEESADGRKQRTEKIEEIVETEETAVEAEAVDTVEDVETEAVEAVEAEAVTTDADEDAMSDEDEQAEA
jgi:large subunit ribosomal protein L9